jgi:hypothetical protein
MEKMRQEEPAFMHPQRSCLPELATREMEREARRN